MFAPKARMSKWSKSIEQLYSSRWSETTDCLTPLRHSPVKLDIPICGNVLLKQSGGMFYYNK